MNKFFFFKCVFVLLVFFSSCSNEEGLIRYVDPMIGTDGHAHTFPGATLPFGMVQVSPSNDFKAWDWCSGYHYSDSILKGFAHTHISGAGLAGLGDILLMPTLGEPKVKAGTEEDPDSGYRSRFSHEREEASPGYYSVVLDDYKVKVELTCTPRVGFHRYTFNKKGNGNVIVDPTHRIMENLYESEIEFLSDKEIRGYKRSNGEGGDRKVYFYAHFSKPFKEKGIAVDEAIADQKDKAMAKDVKAFVSFDVEKGESIEVKVALSFVNYEGAYANYQVEAERTNFDEVHAAAQKVWNDKMNKIQIETKSVAEKRNFYTAMYHTMISPNLISDVTGEYVVEGEKYKSDFDQYSNFSTWDTYRATHPLLSLIEQNKTVDFVNSLSSRFTDSKVGLPVWECLGHDNVCMIGYSSVSVMADAILKDLPGITTESAYEAMRAAAFSLEKHSNNYDVNGMNYYVHLDFVPGEVGCSVSKTTEYNYYDWCLSEVAKKLNKEEDVRLFQQRSKGYRNLFDSQSGYLFPKLRTGELVHPKMDGWDELIRNYVSGNIWGYSSYAPHDMGYLMQLHGGKEQFASWLDGIFADDSEIGGEQHVDISGFIGKYGHGDEPSHQMPYLYNFAGQPWKTQKVVRDILPMFYQDTPGGLANNDDLGQLSAWYIFGTLGFYPVCPGSNQYLICSPAIDRASIQFENGKTFTVVAKNNSKENVYIQSATLNGADFSKPYLTYNQMISGGELVVVMGDQPNKTWGNSDRDTEGLMGLQTSETYDLYESKEVLMPYTKDESYSFESTKEIRLHCNTPEAQIRFTLNGSEPTEKSQLYTAPFLIKNDAIVKAKAFKKGLNPSYAYSRHYWKGIQLNPKTGYPKITLENQPANYGEKTGRQLIDGQFGTTNFNDGEWTGLDKKDLVIDIDLGEARSIHEVKPGYLVYPGVWVFNPESIQVFVSNDNSNFTLAKELKIEPLKEAKRVVERPSLSFAPKTVRFVKLVLKVGIIPQWHTGGGQKSWIFADEILIN